MFLAKFFVTLITIGSFFWVLGMSLYADRNAKPSFETEQKIVFMGDSITEGWQVIRPGFFSGKPYINQGISGETTGQMLARFKSDVINLKPTIVVILGGTNDIAANEKSSALKAIMNNIVSMARLAKASGIKVVLCSVLPVFDYPWSPGLYPSQKIQALNAMIKDYAGKNGIVYCDYYSFLVDSQGGMESKYSQDGVHPIEAGYQVMEPLVEEAIVEALNRE